MEETIIEMKSGYGSDANDFIIDDELMVTITLNEYRNLVKNEATFRERARYLEIEIERLTKKR